MMKKIFLKKMACLLMLLFCTTIAHAAPVSILDLGGWFESGYVTWTGDNQNYTVYIKGGQYAEFTAIDKELVRKYDGYYRADMVGLKAGNYQFKIVGANNSEATSDTFTATAHDRSGFAHVGYAQGIGAYKNDGTLKDGARVIYVTANTAKTVKCNVFDGKTDAEYTGLQAILAVFEKGKETRPLAIRIIGTIKAADCDAFGSSAEGIQVKGKSGATDMNITIEGIGNDATTHGFGFLVRSACCVEFRNFANMVCMDDCVSLDTDNHHVWVHNMDFFYGGTGGDADQAKGDGTVDIKGKSSHITVSYNHFYDSGKCSLGGMKGETTDCWMTYHHNWFDHSDSRHPRIRTAFYHCYNNYYDGNSKYGVGVTSGGSAFVEANYFRNTKYPMLSSKQGTDAEGDGTFSGEPGGVNKAFNNIIINPRKVLYYDGSQTDGKWDAVLVENRADAVTATAFTGGTSYNAAADQAARTQYIENKMDDPEDIPAIVRGDLGAGRLQHGDFKWTFNNSLQDENYDVISDLKQALVNYEGTVVSFADGTAISSRTPKTVTVDGGDGRGLDQETNDSYVPSWAGGGGAIVSGKQVIGNDGDYFYFTAENAEQLNLYMADAASNNDPNTITTNGTFSKTRVISNSTIGSCSDIIGSISVPNKGYITLYNQNGITSAAFYVSSSGSQEWQLSYSNDGKSYTNFGDKISGKAGAHPTVAYSGDGSAKFVRITNTNSSARDVQGVMVYVPGEAALTKLNTTDIALNQGNTYTLTSGIDYATTSTGVITYKTSSPKVATIDASGIITAISTGTANISVSQAKDANHDAAEIKFTVKVTDNRATSNLTVTPTELSMSLGETGKNITPSGNAGVVTYTSGAPSIATVDANGNITAVGYGTASIIVSDEGDASHKPGTATVTVTVLDNRAPSSIEVENDEMLVNRNATVNIVVTKHDGAITFQSTDESIATVDATGQVKGIMAGEVVIVVSDAGDASHKPGVKNVTITVNDNRSASPLNIGDETTVTIDMNISTTYQINVLAKAGTITYDSEDTNIASVNENGLISAKRAGTIKVTVSDTGNDDYLPGEKTITVTVLGIQTGDPITWFVGSTQYTKTNSFSNTSGAQNTFISTDASASELIYVANGGGVKSQKGFDYLDMNGKTAYSSNILSNRYFILPALSGSGTLSVTYAVLDKGRNDIQVRNGNSKASSTLLGTIKFNNNSIRIEGLDNTILYLSADTDKAYIVGITWTPDAVNPTGIQEIKSDETNVSHTKAVKYFKNGKLIIEKNGKRYNAAGALLK